MTQSKSIQGRKGPRRQGRLAQADLDSPEPSKRRELFMAVVGVSLIFFIGHSLFFRLNPRGDQRRRYEAALFRELKILLNEARALMRKHNHAEEKGNEPDRLKYAVQAHEKYLEVLRKIDSLRRPPYVDKAEQWLPGYEHLESYEGQAGQAIHDLTRVGITLDQFEDTEEDKIERALYKHFKAAKSNFAKLEAAEIYNQEDDRLRFIRESRKQFHKVFSQLLLLRKKPYADAEGRWTPTYQRFQTMENEATEKLVSIAKRAYVGDFD